MTIPAIIDLIAAAVLLGFVLLGARRGLFRTLAGVVMIVLAMTGARMAADAIAPAAAEYLTPVVERRIQRQLDEALPQVPAAAGEMPEDDAVGPEELLGLLGIGDERLPDLAEEIREEVRDTGASLLTAAARSVAEPLLYGVFYVLAFAAAMVLLRLAAKVLDQVLKLPVLHGANALGGAAAGFLEGALVLLVLTLVLRNFGVSLEESRILQIFCIFI